MVCGADKQIKETKMKKLIIALAVVAMGVAANAASFAWQVPSGRIFDGTGTSGAAGYSPTVGLTAYLFDAGKYSQETLVSALASVAGVDYTKAISGATTSVNDASRIDAKSFTYDTSASFDAYYVIVGTDKVFISETIASGIQASAEQAIDFASPSTASKVTFTSGTYAANGSGWYTASVPEPTSGLLILLGMAGLALRRKRA